MTTKILWPLFLGAIWVSTSATARNLPEDSIKTSATQAKHHLKKQTLPDSSHLPMVAVKRSAIIPGLGQLYNHQWWKLPVIYAGLGTLLGSAINNYYYYKKHLVVYKYYRNMTTVKKDVPEYQLYTNYKKTGITLTQLENAVNGAQRDTQFYYLCFAGTWGLQVIDAYIDAKLIHSYSMSPDLSIKLKPRLHLQPNGIDALSTATLTPMICMSVNF